jgi:hypothetical protein
MAKLNYNRPNNGYEMEPWDRRKFKNQTQSKALNKTINQESVFIRGKFSGQDIGQLYKRNPKYFVWVLENNPKGIVAQQIIKYFNKTLK